jgi:hypothetical protein
MANTYTLISSTTVTSGTTVSLTSIPQTYTDLLLLVSARSNYTGGGAVSFAMSFNSNGSSYTGRSLQTYSATSVTGNSTTTVTYNGITGALLRSMASCVSGTSTVSTFANSSIYIPNYTSSNYKSYSTDTVSEGNTTASNGPQSLLLDAGLWSNTAAITSIDFGLEVGSFVSPSTFYLYGIKNS